jgi:outer membrane protein OmpA-like peptidoglycan-associated protein
VVLRRAPLLLALSLALLLGSGLVLLGLRVAMHVSASRAAARRLVATVLLGHRTPAEDAALFRQARALVPALAPLSCERGMALAAQGQWAAAAERLRACAADEPGQPYVHLAYARALLRTYDPGLYPEARRALRRFDDALARDPALTDPPSRLEAAALAHEVERLIVAGNPAGSHLDRRYAAVEILAILTRPQARGPSRYDGPRVPLCLAFRPGDAALGTAAEQQLQEAAKALRDGALANTRIQIEGHTDSVEGGSRRARQALSRRRCEVVRDYLTSRCGIAPARLSLAALADDYPLSTNDTEEGRAANRRVELVNLNEKTELRRDVRDAY